MRDGPLTGEEIHIMELASSNDVEIIPQLEYHFFESSGLSSKDDETKNEYTSSLICQTLIKFSVEVILLCLQ
ncbi:hypothetical protein NPIL_407771, partial [Nephila pilipes]